MESTLTVDSRAEANREKRLVALSSLLAAVLLTVLKIVVGVATNSLGILSEAAHSGLDLVAAAITFWAVRMSGRPADPAHTYGHGKFENLSALAETILLLVTCVWIIYESVRRLAFAESVEVEANLWAFLVVVMSILVDVSRSRALTRAAEKHKSQALEADALHFSTDVWSSCVVFFGLIGVTVGKKFDLPWFIQADTVAALGVAAIVIYVGVKLGKKSIDDLLDSVPEHLSEQVASVASQVPGVEDVRQVRVRRSGPEVFADVTVSVNHAATFEQTHRIADQTEDAVRSIVPEADVVVHVEPVSGDEEPIVTTTRVLAARHGLGAHGIRVYERKGVRSLELHLEVNESLTLEQAHEQATRFEEDIRRNVPDLLRVVTHIEPAGDASATIRAETAGRAEVTRAIHDFIRDSSLRLEPHDITVQRTGGELAISFHCTLDASTSITAAHDLTERLEKHLRAQVPAVGRVVIHVEPTTQA